MNNLKKLAIVVSGVLDLVLGVEIPPTEQYLDEYRIRVLARFS